MATKASTAEIFVDTGAWIALADTGDRFHSAGVSEYPRILRQSGRLVTTNLVIAESYNLLRRRLGHAQAIHFLDSLRQSLRLVKIYSDHALESEAESILRRYDDQDFSLADAVSFAVMRVRGISQAFAFDRHFLVAGYELVPVSF